MGTTATNNLENEIRSLVAEIMEIDEEKITPDAKFVEELGIDSMMALASGAVTKSTESSFSIRRIPLVARFSFKLAREVLTSFPSTLISSAILCTETGSDFTKRRASIIFSSRVMVMRRPSRRYL